MFIFKKSLGKNMKQEEENKDEKVEKKDEKPNGGADFGLNPLPADQKRDEPTWDPKTRVDL